MIPVKFKCSDSMIKGYFFPTDQDSVLATLIFLQGFPGVQGDELICEKLAQVGVNVLTFNYRGTFQSEGFFSFSNVIEDTSAALRFIKGSKDLSAYPIDPGKIILGGWSFGAAMVPAGAIRNPEFGKIFMISGRNFGKEARKIEGDLLYANQVAKNLDSMRSPHGPISYQDDVISNLVEHKDSYDYEKLAPRLKDRDILLIGGWDDDITTIEGNTLPLYRRLLESGAMNVRIEAVQDDHEFSKSKDQIVRTILNWLEKE